MTTRLDARMEATVQRLLEALASPLEARVLGRNHQDVQTDLNVTSLALDANRSVAAFHVHFKAVAQNSPIQYVKAARPRKRSSCSRPWP